MKTVVVILVILLVVVAAILILAAMKPATFRITRATSIKAPPEKIFPLIDDLRNWSAWSPWEKKDPAMTRTHSGGRTRTASAAATVTASLPTSRLSAASAGCF